MVVMIGIFKNVVPSFRRGTMLNASMSIIMQVFERRIIWVLLAVSFVFNVFRWQFFSDDVGEYSEMLLLMVRLNLEGVIKMNWREENRELEIS